MTTSFFSRLSTSVVGATLIAFGMSLATPSQATTITKIVDYTTSGDEMAGMDVTVNFLDGDSETVKWVSLGSQNGGALGNGWSLTQSGDTFNQPWTFDNTMAKDIVSLTINAIPGDTVFDIFEMEEGTPGSAQGLFFDPISGHAPASSVYSDIVNLKGQPPVGDLFGVLTLDWNEAAPFTSNSKLLMYKADTDTIETPEPTSLLGLLAFSALGASSLLKRKQK